MKDPIIEACNLVKYFPVEHRGVLLRKQIGVVHAVDDVSFSIKEGETLGLVGESGCGKTTTALLLLHLIEPTSGEIFFEGRKVREIFGSRKRNAILEYRRKVQYVFQNPYTALNPRMTVADIILEPLAIHGHVPKPEWKNRLRDLLKIVGLEEYHSERYPHEFSGGQRQRISIARALAVEPRFLILDEPVASLDVSIRAQVLNLLRDLQSQFSLSYLYISHDLGTVKHISDRVAVMYLGKIVELAHVDELYELPKHPYTEALMSAIPIPELQRRSQRQQLRGEVASPINPPSGCRFHPRCPYAIEECKRIEPQLENISPSHLAACIRTREIQLAGATTDAT